MRVGGLFQLQNLVLESFWHLLSWAHMTIHSVGHHAYLTLVFPGYVGAVARASCMLLLIAPVWDCLHWVSCLCGVLVTGRIFDDWLGLVTLLLLIMMTHSKSIVVSLRSEVQGCDIAILLTRFRCAFVENVTTGSVWPLVFLSLLENERCSLRADSIELLLLCDEVHLGLWLHLVAHLGLGKYLLMLLWS